MMDELDKETKEELSSKELFKAQDNEDALEQLVDEYNLTDDEIDQVLNKDGVISDEEIRNLNNYAENHADEDGYHN